MELSHKELPEFAFDLFSYGRVVLLKLIVLALKLLVPLNLCLQFEVVEARFESTDGHSRFDLFAIFIGKPGVICLKSLEMQGSHGPGGHWPKATECVVS
jgi:hypothetical protein